MENNLKIISWNITRQCNLRCAHCYLPASFRSGGNAGPPPPDELRTAEALGVIDDIARTNHEAMLVLSGGEPLLRTDIYELAEHAADRGMMVVLGTNGLLINDVTAEKLKQKGVSGVSISLDSATPEIHNAVRHMDGAWERAVNAVHCCRKQGLSVQINTVITGRNIGAVPELVAYARSLGARVFSPFFLVCTGYGEELTDITPEEYEQLLSAIIAMQGEGNGVMIRTRCAPTFRRILYQRDPGSSLLKLDAGKCMAGTHYCRITPEGDVTPCPYLPDSAGNVKEQGFHGIWTSSPAFSRLRNPSLKGKCGACEYQRLCGGCRARAYSIHEDIMEEDPWCVYSPDSGAIIEPPSFEPGPSWPDFPGMSELYWTAEAEERLKRVPFFVRSMVRGAVERYAVHNSHHEITPEIMQKARQNYGMEKMAGK